MSGLARQALAIIYPAHITKTPTWDVGPFPFTHYGVRADAATRATYHSPKASRLLCGTAEHPTRWHRHVHFPGENTEVVGLEILRAEDQNGRRGWLILHVRGTGRSPLPMLRAVAGRTDAPPVPFDFDQLVESQAELDRSHRPFTLAFVSAHRRGLPRLLPRLRYRRWPRADQWLWALASRTSHRDYPPDPHSRHTLLAPTLRLSADWQALVLRDGAAFVGTRADRGDGDAFFGHAELFVRTIYLDTLLLGALQDYAITGLEEQLGVALDDPRPHVSMAALEEDLTRFRQRLWWLHITSHGAGNDLLSAYQDQHRLGQRYAHINSAITEFNHSAREDTGQNVQATVGLLTLVTIPATVVFAALQVVGVKSPLGIAASIVVVGLATAGLMLTRPARLVLRSTRQRLYRILGQHH